MQRLGAVVAHAHGDAPSIEQLPHIVRVHAVDCEGYQASTLGGVGGAEQSHTIDLLNSLNQAGAQFVFPRLNVLHTQVLQVAHSSSERDCLRDALGTCLKLDGGGHILGVLQTHAGNHGATGQEGRQGVQQFGTAIEGTDAGGCQHLVAGERREVDVQGVEVYGHVRYGLAGVQHNERAVLASQGNHAGHVGNCAGHVRDVGERHDAGLLVDNTLGSLVVELTVLGGGDVAQGRAGSLGKNLPGDEVRVVLNLGGDDFIAGAQRETLSGGTADTLGGVTNGVGNQVQRLGCVGGPHDLFVSGAHEVRYGDTRILKQVGCLNREGVGAAVHGGVSVQVEVAFCVEHLKGFLAGRPRIQVNQGMPVDLGVEDREVLAKLAYDVVAQRGVGGGGVFSHGYLLLSLIRSTGRVFSRRGAYNVILF